MNTRAYLFHGLKLVISGEEWILTALEHRLGRFPAAKPGTPSHLRFEFRRVPDPSRYAIQQPCGPNRRVLEMRGGQVLYYAASHQLYIDFPDRGRALCDLESGEVRVSYPESEAGNAGWLAYPCFTIPLAELLKRHGLYMAHAAGLSLDGQGLLLAGASGAGKTTLAIALLRAGFGFLGDDTLFLCARAQGLRALAFPDQIDITAHTASFFPELQDLARAPLPGGRPKQSLSPARVYRAVPSWECAPAVLVFPQVARASKSSLTPMPKDAAFLELVCNVVRTEAHSAQAHLAALAALVNQCLCLRLRTGRDFDAVPALLRSALNQIHPAQSVEKSSN
jgi:hypothetical protein